MARRPPSSSPAPSSTRRSRSPRRRSSTRTAQAYSLTEDTDKDLTLVFFGYTHCPDICGQVMATLAGTMTRLDDDAARPAWTWSS